MKRRSSRRSAFTVLELTISAALVAIIGSLMFVSQRPTAAKATSSSLAGALAMELRQARQLAIASQVPVAIAFPGTDGGGARPLCSSFYQLEGATAPRITRVVDFKGDFPGCTIFNGSWNTNSAQFRNAGAPANQANPPIPGQKWASLDLDKWLPAASKSDYCFVFCPDGTVKTNDLGSFDYAYHILVSQGVGSYSGTGAPANLKMAVQPAYFTPSVLGETQTIQVDIGGSVSTVPGVSCLASGVTAANQVSGPSPVQRRSRTTPLLPTPSTPVISIKPDTPDSSAGAQVAIGPDQFITLEATVTDTNNSGQRLYCNWSVQAQTGNVGAGPSDYSIPVQSGRGAAMDWDPNANAGAGAWHSVWQWRPPADGSPGDRYELGIVVQDSAGANLTAIIKKEVKVCPAGQVLYQSGITTGAGMFKMNPDGGSKQAFHVSPYDRGNPVGCNEGWASASIDGSRLAFCSARPDVVGGPFQTTNQIYVTDRSGNGCFRVSDLPHGCEMPSISPLGDLVAYRYSLGGNSHYCVVNTDPVLGNRNIYTFDSVTGADSVWSGAMTAPRRDLVFDQISWDTHCDDPDRADTLYYCKQVGASATPTGIFKVQIQRNANGQPIGIRSGSTIAPILNGVSPYGTRSPHFFMDQNQVDYLFHCLDDTDPYIASSGAGAARSGGLREEQPCPWMEGTNLRLFAVDVNAAVTPFNSTIVRFTPPMSMTAPADRVPLTSVNQAIFPVYLPPAP